ncbi:MAG: biotin transporter BioY [Clostridia bacterium]|nr:biotin transporter BioY [Clostridia bacterium]
MSTPVKGKTQLVVLTAICTALMIVGGFIRFPIGTVPITLQTICVLFIGSYAGKKIGAVAVAIYLILGLIGLPVFSAGGGLFYVTHPTFGYLIGMLGGVAIAGALPKKIAMEHAYRVRIGLNLLAVLLIHVVGVTYMYLIANYLHETPLSIWTAIYTGSLIFIPFDVISAIVSALISGKLSTIKPIV